MKSLLIGQQTQHKTKQNDKTCTVDSELDRYSLSLSVCVCVCVNLCLKMTLYA